MTKDIENSKLAPPSYYSVAWPPFAQKLATILEKLEEDQFLILSVKHSNRFVQFAAQGSFGMRVETTSNNYLAKPEKLNDQQIATLVEAGWHVPTGSSSDSTPEDDPDGSPNFFVEYAAPVSFEEVANLTVHTLTKILRVPHPGNLQYAAFDEAGEAIELPELGLKQDKPAPETVNHDSLLKQLLATLKKTTGIGEMSFDEDGDIAIRYGSAITFVHLIDDPLYIRIFSPILRDVVESPGILTRLNDINANASLIRYFYQNGTVYGVADIPAVPFNSSHVAETFAYFCNIVDGIDSLLQEEFGGMLAFDESEPSLMKH
jgi:hypothetical protein